MTIFCLVPKEAKEISILNSFIFQSFLRRKKFFSSFYLVWVLWIMLFYFFHLSTCSVGLLFSNRRRRRRRWSNFQREGCWSDVQRYRHFLRLGLLLVLAEISRRSFMDRVWSIYWAVHHPLYCYQYFVHGHGSSRNESRCWTSIKGWKLRKKLAKSPMK